MGETNQEELIPKSRVFARAVELGLAPTDERLETFYKAQLLRELQRIEGTTQRGFTSVQGNRFLALLWLCKVLRKPRPPELAFWLCWYGFEDVPSELVCEHVENTVLRYLRVMRREFQRKRVPIDGVRDPAQWRTAGKPLAKSVFKHNFRRPITNPLAFEVLSGIIGLALRALISKSSFEAVASWLGRVGFLIGIDRSKTDALREIWSALTEGMELFDLDESKNPLLKAVREVRANDPGEIIELVRDGRPTVWLLGTVMPIVNPPAPPVAQDPSDAGAVFVAKNFAPGIVGTLAFCRNFPHMVEMRRQFREGNYQEALGEFHQVKVVAQDIGKRIGLGVNE
jgi:hypothetical protein